MNEDLAGILKNNRKSKMSNTDSSRKNRNKRYELEMHPRLQVFLACSFTLEVPDLQCNEELMVRIGERELLERGQREASVDDAVIITQYFK